MNKTVLVGRLTKDPEIKFTSGKGTSYLIINMAVDNYNSATKEKGADFIPLKFWGKQAETVANYCKKGSQLAISGRIETSSYDAKDGTKRYSMGVTVQELQLLGNPGNNNNNNNNNNSPSYNEFDKDMTPVPNDGDIPF